MSNITVMETKGKSEIQKYSPETVSLIKNTVAPANLTDKEFEMFIYQAKRTGLDPLSRQIYCIKTKDKVSIQATIDGFRLIAERTGLYQGQTPVMWCGDDGQWTDVWLSKDFPSAAKVGILRAGFTEPLYAIARWFTYAQTDFNGNYKWTWNKMPDLMLGKCAEALALRKAFPQELSNLYSDDEIGVIQSEHDNHTEKPVKVTLPDNPFKQMDNAKTLDEVKALWIANKDLQKDKKFAELKDKKKIELSEQAEEDETDEAIQEANYEVEETENTDISDLEYAINKIESLTTEAEVTKTANELLEDLPLTKKEKQELDKVITKHIGFINKSVE